MMADEDGKDRATGRLEFFVVAILNRLTRVDVQECLQQSRNSYGATGDSYAEGVVASLIGDWDFRKYIETLVAKRHADLLVELEAAKALANSYQSRMWDIENMASNMRNLADRLDPPKKAE